MDITKKLALLLLHHAPASHAPSASIVSETLCLTIVPIDGKSFASPFHVNAHPSTKIVVMHNLICNELQKIHIREFCQFYFEYFASAGGADSRSAKGQKSQEPLQESLTT
jgi:hypothetical protein